MNAFEFVTKTVHIDGERIFINIAVRFPQHFHQYFPLNDASLVFQECSQNLCFVFGKLNRTSFKADFVASGIQTHTPMFEKVAAVGIRKCPTKQRLDLGDENRRIKGLGDIVICALIECGYYIHAFIGTGNEDDRHAGCLANLTGPVKTVLSGQMQIHQNQIRTNLLHLFGNLFEIFQTNGFKPPAVDQGSQSGRNRMVVFNDQDFVHGFSLTTVIETFPMIFLRKSCVFPQKNRQKKMSVYNKTGSGNDPGSDKKKNSETKRKKRNMSEKKTKAPILFDLDGTLWDTREGIVESWNATLRSYGEPEVVTVENLTPLLGKTTQAFADAFLPQASQERQNEIMEAITVRENEDLERDQKFTIYPGAIETIKELAKDHWIGIVSNCEKGYTEIFLKAAGLESTVDGFLCFGDTKQPKSYTIRKLLDNNQIANGFYVGDTTGDQQAAQGAGLPFIWAEYGYGKEVEKEGMASITDLVKDPKWESLIDQPLIAK